MPHSAASTLGFAAEAQVFGGALAQICSESPRLTQASGVLGFVVTAFGVGLVEAPMPAAPPR